MTKIVTLFILLCSSLLSAQPATVLVCSTGDSTSLQLTLTSLKNYYTGTIDVSDSITSVINNYDAVFVLLTNWKHPLTANEAITLKDFLHSNKKLFVEYQPGTMGEHTATIDSNGFWHFVGIDRIGIDALNYMTEYAKGVSGTFTEGMSIANPKPYDALDGTWIIEGNMHLVLSSYPDPSDYMGVSYETDSFKVVLFSPFFSECRDEFLGRVICNYFGLCTPLAASQTPTLTSSITVYPNPAMNTLHIMSPSDKTLFHSIELSNELGKVVSIFALPEARSQFTLDLSPLHLGSGSYWLTLKTDKENICRPIYLYTK